MGQRAGTSSAREWGMPPTAFHAPASIRGGATTVVPELDLKGRAIGAMWYHLDGGDARQHLPRLLALPYLRVIQYVPRPAEPPNGMAHLPMYRQIQQAGRIVHIQIAADQVEPLCRALDPRLLMLDVSWSCKSPDEGRELLRLLGMPFRRGSESTAKTANA